MQVDANLATEAGSDELYGVNPKLYEHLFSMQYKNLTTEHWTPLLLQSVITFCFFCIKNVFDLISINQSIYLSKCKTNTGPDTKGGCNLR